MEAALSEGSETFRNGTLEEPEIQHGDEFYLLAFHELSTTRSFGMGAAPIPWQHIASYAERSGLDREMTSAFHRIIRMMDQSWLDWAQSESERSRG